MAHTPDVVTLGSVMKYEAGVYVTRSSRTRESGEGRQAHRSVDRQASLNGTCGSPGSQMENNKRSL